MLYFVYTLIKISDRFAFCCLSRKGVSMLSCDVSLWNAKRTIINIDIYPPCIFFIFIVYFNVIIADFHNIIASN